MIAKAAPKRRSGRGSFTDLRQYLERNADGQTRPDLLASWSGNVMSHVTADLDMERIAGLGRVGDPVYHAILSWRPHEIVAEETARGAIDAVLRSVGAEDHQWYAALHHDEADGRTHVHLAVNRVHPISTRGLDIWKDNAKLARAAEWVERAYGCLPDRRMAWREHIAEVDLGFSIEAAEAYVQRRSAQRMHAEPPGARQSEMDAVRRAGYSWATLLDREAIPAALAAVAREGATWSDLHAALETYHVHLERTGSGLRIVGAEPGQHLKASRVGLGFRALERRLGPYVTSPKVESDFSARLERLESLVRTAGSWDGFHAALAGEQVALEQRGRGGRVRDLESNGRSVPLGRLGTSLPALERRLGPYVIADALRQQEQREAARRQAAVTERLAEIGRHPDMLLDRLVAHHAVWRGSDVEQEIARVVGVERDELLAHHQEALDDARERVLGCAQRIGSGVAPGLHQDGREGEPLYSTAAVIAEERRTFAAVQSLATCARTLTLRAPSSELDTQQRDAYAHLADGASDLRVATGIAGAGKSRLLRDVCAAYAEAGYTVRGAAVAGSAARVLGEEAQIPARTVARLLLDIDNGKERLHGRSVIVVDEASMLGTADACRLFEAVRDAGARVLLLGDVQQHEAVARGPVLGEIVERHARCDLGTTRRAQEQWLRDVGTDLRAGRVGRAMGVLRERGCVAEHERNAEAMGMLVGRYTADVRDGQDALLIASRRAEVGQLNAMVREAMRDRLGAERTYTTAFGARAFAVNDRVVTREPHRDSGTVNGDTWVVTAHARGGRLELLRDRDGARVRWDVRERPALDHGYATTSYRSQGRTVENAYVLATKADAQRGLYVDVTRARKNVLVAYGRDEVADFGALLNVAARDRAKLTATAVERAFRSVPYESQEVKAEAYEHGLSPAMRDVYKRSETFAQSMRRKLHEVTANERIDGTVAWKRALPESGKTLLLIDDGRGTYYRCTGSGDMALARIGQRVQFGEEQTPESKEENDRRKAPVSVPIVKELPSSEIVRDIFKRSETYTQSMRKKLHDIGEGESIEGTVVWKRDLPENRGMVLLINDGQGTYHRCAVRMEEKQVDAGQSIALERDAGEEEARLTLRADKPRLRSRPVL
jgi:hypothetical protein